MPYKYTAITLESIDPTGVNIRPVKAFLPAAPVTTPEFSMGELVRLKMDIDATTGASKFRAEEQFCFSLRLFSSPDEIHHFIPQSKGWRIKIKQGAAGLVADWGLSTGGREPIDQNFSINSITISSPSERTLSIEFDFYITQDLQEWIGFGFIDNNQRWLQNQPLATNELSNFTESAFKRLESYMEIAFFQCDDNLLPFTLTGAAAHDPIARDVTAGQSQYETFAIKLGLKWYDQIVGAQNDWINDTTKVDNWLKSIEINAGNWTTPITEVTRKGDQAEYEDTLRNFNFDQRGENTTQLVINELGDTTAQKNNVTIKIGSPNLADYTNVVLQLIRVEQQNDGVNFAQSYQLFAADIPKAQPAVTVLNGPIETPSAFAVAAGELTIDFILNGEKLEAGANYQMIVLLYKNDGGDDFSSVHTSPTISTTAANVNVPTIEGFIDTYNNTFGPAVNDVSIASFERIKLRLRVDSNPYGAAAFLTDLQGIRLTSTILGETVADVSSTSFPQGIPTANPRVITITDLGGGLFSFECEFRGYYAATVTRRSFHKWELIFNPSGPNQHPFTGRFEQRLTHRPEDTVRLPSMRILEFGVFPGILTEKIYICENLDTKVVVEVTKSGAPNANLLAMILNDTPTQEAPGVIPSVDEEESYGSAFLPTLTSPHIESVDTTFLTQLDPDKAYFVVDVDFLTTFKFFNALIYDI